MESGNYWFALKSHVYVELKEKNILLYDTKSGSRIETKKWLKTPHSEKYANRNHATLVTLAF